MKIKFFFIVAFVFVVCASRKKGRKIFKKDFENQLAGSEFYKMFLSGK